MGEFCYGVLTASGFDSPSGFFVVFPKRYPAIAPSMPVAAVSCWSALAKIMTNTVAKMIRTNPLPFTIVSEEAAMVLKFHSNRNSEGRPATMTLTKSRGFPQVSLVYSLSGDQCYERTIDRGVSASAGRLYRVC